MGETVLDAATLQLGRHTPRTARQRESAMAGIAQCDADWDAGELTTSADMIRQGRDKFWRAGYGIRWLENAATLKDRVPCDERGHLVSGEGVSPGHADSCSLHPANVV